MVYLDTNILIYLFENHPNYAHGVATYITTCQKAGTPLITSAITVAELIAGNKNINLKTIKLVHGLQIIPVSEDIAEYAGKLQVKNNMHIGDAIHLATALASDCKKIYTNDAKLAINARLDIEVIKP